MVSSAQLLLLLLLIGGGGAPASAEHLIAWDIFEETAQAVIVLPKDETAVRFVWGNLATTTTSNTVVVTSTITVPTGSAAPTTVSPTQAQAPTAAPTDPVNVGAELDFGMLDFDSRRRRGAPAADSTNAPGPRLFNVMSGTNRSADGRIDSGVPSASGALSVDIMAFLRNGTATSMGFFCSEHPGLAVTVRLAAMDTGGGPETSFEQAPEEDASETSSSATVIGAAVGMMLVAVLLGVVIRRKFVGSPVTGRKRMTSSKTKKSATDEITDRKLEWQKKEAKSEPHRLLEILRTFREEQRALKEEEQARRRSKSAACGGPGGPAASTLSSKSTGSTTAAGWQWLSVERIQQKVQGWIMSPPKAAPSTPRVESRLPPVGDTAVSTPHFPQSEALAAWQDPTIAKPKARRSSSRRSSLSGAAKHIDVEPDEPEYAVVPPWSPLANKDTIYATIEEPASIQIDAATMELKALSQPSARNSVLVSPTRHSVGEWSPRKRTGLSGVTSPPIATTLGRPVRGRTVGPGAIVGISTLDPASRSHTPLPETASTAGAFDYNNDALAVEVGRTATERLLIVACARLDREPASYDKTALAFAKGDHIHVVHKHANGLWEGAVVQSDGYSGAIGYFPFTIVDVLEQSQFTAADRRLQGRLAEGRLSNPTVERNKGNEPHRPSPIMLSGKGEWPFVSSTRANPLFDAAVTAAACAEALDTSSNRRLSTSSNSSFTPIREYE